MTDESGDVTDRPRPSRRKLAIVLTPIIIAVIFGYVSAAFLPKLVDDHPLALISMNARLRNIVLVANELPFLPLLLVAVARRLVLDPFFFALGRMYREPGVRWAESKMGDAAPVVQFIERWFQKVGWLFVMTYPGEIVCTLAGATGMRLRKFLLLDVAGTLIFVSLTYQAAEFLDGPIGVVTRFIGRYSLPLTVVTFAFTVFYIWNQQRTGQTVIETVDQMERELQVTDPEPGRDQP